ncbi:hypothetical protein [Amycolatopsis sp. NPDC004378]
MTSQIVMVERSLGVTVVPEAAIGQQPAIRFRPVTEDTAGLALTAMIRTASTRCASA